MIYHITWSGLAGQPGMTIQNNWQLEGAKKLKPDAKIGDPYPNVRDQLAHDIKGSKDDSFIFILVNKSGQVAQWEEWVKANDLEGLVVKRSGLVTNPVHPNNGPNLMIAVIQSKDHFQQKEQA